MTTTFLAGKIIMSLATVIYGFVPALVDLNKTHATNPLWVGHARFHVVWQVMIQAGIGLLSLYSLWIASIEPRLAINLSLVCGLIVLVSFQINVFARKFYQGTLADPNGVPPMFGGKVDTNVFAFTLGLIILLAGYSLARFA